VTTAPGRASPHTRQASLGRNCTRRTQRYAGRCPKMPARCGRVSSEPGTSDRQDVQSQRAKRWTTAGEVGTSCFLRTGLSARPSITAYEGRAVTPQYAIPAIGSLFNIAQSPKPALAFSSNLLPKKKDRAAFAGGPSQGGNALGRAATAGGGWPSRILFCKSKDPA